MESNSDESTLARKVYANIRPKILLGEIGPGARLSLKDVSQEQGVSLSVVREAVTRLASEELVEAIPQHGFRVRSASIPDLLDLTWVRVQVESLAIRDSIERGDLDWECALVSAHHKLSSSKMVIDGRWSPFWASAHSEFHAALVAACASPILLRIRQQLYNASEIYRAWSAASPGVHSRDVAAEHAALMEAALSRNTDLAASLQAEHLQETARLITESRQPPPELLQVPEKKALRAKGKSARAA